MAAKIAKNSNFWYKFAPKKKSRSSIEKLEYRCTTRNLPLCNGSTILFLQCISYVKVLLLFEDALTTAVTRHLSNVVCLISGAFRFASFVICRS